VVKALVSGEKAQTQMLTVDQVFAEEIKGTNPKAWATPNTLDHLDTRTPEGVWKQATGARAGRIAPSNLREQVDPMSVEIYQKVNGSRPASWATATVSTGAHRQKDGSMTPKLDRQVKAWATPQSRDAKGAEGRMIRNGKSTDLPSQTEVEQTGAWNRNNGKLNPRWVETLMGLPVGWTMPSCASPVTIELMNSVSSATESSQPQQPKHS
jgi:hypothetical protein